MKRFLVIFMVLVSGLIVFANGSNETSQSSNQEDCPFYDLIESQPKIELIGSVNLSNRILPELTTNNKVYQLIGVPRYRGNDFSEIDVSNVSVKGIPVNQEFSNKIENLMESNNERHHRGKNGFHSFIDPEDDSQNLFLVTEITVNGKSYNTQELGFGHRGRRSGKWGMRRGKRR